MVWVVGALVVIVVVVLVLTRARAARAERRSVESYGHGLAALGDVAKRTAPSGSVRVVPRGGPAGAQGTVAGEGATDGRLPPGTSPGQVPSSRGRYAVTPPGAAESAGTGGPVGEGRRRPAQEGPVPYAALEKIPPQSRVRTLIVTCVAVAGVLFVTVLSVVLALHDTASSSRPPHTHSSTPPPSSVTLPSSVTTTTRPSITPISTTGSDATFRLPPGRYRLRFHTTTGPCWVGIETSLGSGVYLFAETVEPGATASYVAHGPIAVVLGAPEYASVAVNGLPVRIPPGVTAYNLVFSG